jgi:hypothetical protein
MDWEFWVFLETKRLVLPWANLFDQISIKWLEDFISQKLNG